ncbi:MAG: cytochrome c biogenesis protein ResB [Aeromicrobium erythreum]
MSPGQEQSLPGGGTIAFTDLRLFARFQISETPLLRVPLIGTSIGILGLLLSLFVRPRRAWVRARREGSRTVVEIAALDRVRRDDLPDELQELVDRVRRGLPGADAQDEDDAGPADRPSKESKP